MNATLEQIKQEILSGAEEIKSSKEAYEFRKKFLDGKSGKIGLLMREMKNIPPEQRADYGKGVNELKEWALVFLGGLDEKMKAKDTSPLFSQKPYVLIADYDMLAKAKSLVNMGRTHFEGSKIFYVIFISDNPKKNAYLTSTFAKNICAVKSTVLFGQEGLKRASERVTEDEILTAKHLGYFIRDSIPFIEDHQKQNGLTYKMQSRF